MTMYHAACSHLPIILQIRIQEQPGTTHLQWFAPTLARVYHLGGHTWWWPKLHNLHNSLQINIQELPCATKSCLCCYISSLRWLLILNPFTTNSLTISESLDFTTHLQVKKVTLLLNHIMTSSYRISCPGGIKCNRVYVPMDCNSFIVDDRWCGGPSEPNKLGKPNTGSKAFVRKFFVFGSENRKKSSLGLREFWYVQWYELNWKVISSIKDIFSKEFVHLATSFLSYK